MYCLLLVDDDPAIRSLFSRLLEREGYTVHTVPGGRECLDQLQTMTPDLIILDIMMTPMDGWETLSEIKKVPAIHDIPVVMFSGKVLSRDDIQQYGGLIEDYLMKPLEFGEISDTIIRIIERSRERQAEMKRLIQMGINQQFVSEYFGLLSRITILRTLVHQARGFPDEYKVIIRDQEKQLQLARTRLGIGPST